MPINKIKDAEGRPRFQFEFSRRLGGGRQRVRKLLPCGWSRAQADAFDRIESNRLHAEATGVQERQYTIDQAVARYIAERVPALKHGLNTVQEIDHLASMFVGRPMADLRKVCADYTAAQREILAPATIKNRLRYLVAACRWGWKRHSMCASDPGAGIVFPTVRNERQVYIDRRQMLVLARACQHWETRALIRILFYSGMRLGEAIAAEVVDGCFVLPDSKNGDPIRIPIHPKIRCLTGYTWPTRFMISYHFRAARAAVGMDHLHIHDLRHSTASDLVSGGHSLFVVGKVLRHKSAASTQRYAHLHDDVLLAAVNSIGKRRA